MVTNPPTSALPEGLALAQLVEFSEARAYASLFSAAQAAEPTLGFSTQQHGGAVLLRAHAVNNSLLVNRVLGLGLAQPVTEADVAALVQAYAGGSVAFGVELSPAALPADLPALLRAQRLRKAFPAQILVRDGSAPPPRYASWQRAAGLSVQIAGPEQADTLARLCCSNFDMPEPVRGLLRLGSCAPGWRRWLALDGEQPVGGSLSYVQDGVAWLGWTSVCPSHRGRWVHAGIVARQLEDAHAAGCTWVTTETAISSKEKPDAAYHNLRNFGFQDAYLRPVHVYQPRRPSLGSAASAGPSAGPSAGANAAPSASSASTPAGDA